ncbi:MAG: M18 family aminopeptidase [Prevotella sp.]|nr:M18 family aminopeptidase [Prevotella sp.]MCM1075175.1 M18 family aminopeptidase [Ruminococcus sp.]
MINQLLNWLDASTCNVLAVNTIASELTKVGFTELSLADKWNLKGNAKYFTTINRTAIFAFITGEVNVFYINPQNFGATDTLSENGFHIIASHSDSPCLKLKPNADIYCEGGVIKLNVEKYGGGILYTWFDRPLSISGRVALRSDNPLRPDTRIFDLQKPIATIPHLAIHFNRAVNEGNPLSVQRDMLPVVGVFPDEEINQFKLNGGFVKDTVAKHLGIDPSEILDYELNLYPIEKAHRIGANGSLFQSGRIDDLSMAFASLRAFLDAADTPSNSTRVLAVFDNEETGSGTKQGAGSPVLANILERISNQLAAGGEDKAEAFHRTIANSFMISADDAHAWHPNYDGKYDPTNHALMGHGPAIKINANCKYMTDADSAAVFHALCEEAGVPVQYFVNHSDVLGGSTLGNILTGQMPLRGVDMGAPIWAMHSAAETASCADHEATVRAFTAFYRL